MKVHPFGFQELAMSQWQNRQNEYIVTKGMVIGICSFHDQTGSNDVADCDYLVAKFYANADFLPFDSVEACYEVQVDQATPLTVSMWYSFNCGAWIEIAMNDECDVLPNYVTIESKRGTALLTWPAGDFIFAVKMRITCGFRWRHSYFGQAKLFDSDMPPVSAY